VSEPVLRVRVYASDFMSGEDEKEDIRYVFHCPGCGYGHWFKTGGTKRPKWEFNDDLYRPTVRPSILVNAQATHLGPNGRCHSFITDGRIQFLMDCWHDLRGMTVDLPELEEEDCW